MMKSETFKARTDDRLRLFCTAVLAAAILVPATTSAAVPVDLDGKVKLLGDMRVRGEADSREKQTGVGNADNKSAEKRIRLRYRVRFGVVFQPNDNWLSKIRLATTSGQNSPHVNWATVGDTADLSLGVDTAYIAYIGVKNLTLVGGKTPLNFWQQNEIFLDADIHPDALAAVYKVGSFTLNGAYAVLTAGNWDSKPDNLTALTYQAVFKGGSKLKYTAALGGASVSAPANTFQATQHAMVSGQLKSGPWLAGGDFLQSNANNNKTAYVVQGRYKVTKTIGLRAYYYYVGAYATLGDGTFTQDNFPSARQAADNFTGFRLQMDYKVAKGTSMDVRYYDTTILTRDLTDRIVYDSSGNNILVGMQDAKNSRLQVNVNVKF